MPPSRMMSLSRTLSLSRAGISRLGKTDWREERRPRSPVRRALRLAALALIFLALPRQASRSADAQVALPGGTKLQEVDFGRHVLPLISRFGCNAGACHGSFQGRGGFRLSLFGQDERADFAALVEHVDVDVPHESLLLTKASGQVEHGGGRRIAPDSWAYAVLLAWVRQGAHFSPKATRAPLKLVPSPAAIHFLATGATARLRVSARLSDSTVEDVNPFCRLESNDPGTVELGSDGQLRALQPGTTHVVVIYAGLIATVPATVRFVSASGPGETSITRQRADTGPGNAIDVLIDRRLDELGLPAQPLADDASFLRRATLDVLGRLPTVEEVRDFLQARDPQKRERTIERLLDDPQHASVWATRLCDLTGCRVETIGGPDELKPAHARMWHAWFRRRIADNVPFDRIVRGVLSGTSRGGRTPEQYIDREVALAQAALTGGVGNYDQSESLDLFYRRTSPDVTLDHPALAERVAAAFLGVRIQCARCHKHPYDRWTQGDYASFVNVFADVAFGSSTELNRAVLAHLAEDRRQREAGRSPPPLPRSQEVYLDRRLAQPLDDPATKAPAPPRAIGGPLLAAAGDPRDALVDWMLRDDNPYFTANWVNRVWAHYFGRGLVEPVDSFSATNPPTHPELLDWLAAEFRRSGFDLRHVERLILCSNAYQRSSKPINQLADAARYYACAPVRPLMAEAIVEAAEQALGERSPWPKEIRRGGTVFDVAADRPTDPRLAYLFELFGRGNRESVCDCDRSPEPTLRQTLHLMSDAEWVKRIEKSPLVTELAAAKEEKVAVERAFLRSLSRLPTPAEEQMIHEHIRAARSRRDAWNDIVWALLNTRELRTNH
ncbi:MAG TPA: DUF1549 and DUF1553 domain-containing protein [Planctomycetaceae bacterium]|nr:DUF1549 and DUF1553 domain-containing protein [Planctomycetaceae bacterium]